MNTDNERVHRLSIRTPEGIRFSYPLAGPLTRFMAWALDLACLFLLVGTLQLLLRLVYVYGPDVAAAGGLIGSLALSFGYPIALEWANGGQTLGKRLLGLRVMDAQGLRLRFSQVVVRNLLRAIDGLPALYLVGGAACFCSPLAQRLGDLAAQTVVVRASQWAAPDLASAHAPRYNSLRAHPHLVARLRRRIAPFEAGLALQALLRRDTIDADARVALFRRLAADLREQVPLPEDLTRDLSDEQFVRNVVDVLFVKDQSAAAPAPSSPASREPVVHAG